MEKYRLVTRSDFDGLVCAVLLKELDMIDDKAMGMVGLQAEELEHLKTHMLATVEKITSKIEKASGEA